MKEKALWMATGKCPRFAKLQKDTTADVAVIGAGITGVTAAYLLKKAGLTVVLLDRERCATVDTGHTTAHLSFVTDMRLPRLIKNFGREWAQLAWEAGRTAIDEIQRIVEKEEIDCDFARLPAYLHTAWNQSNDESKELLEDARQAEELGFDAVYMDSVPFAGRPGVRFPNQAKFHPRQYLAVLLDRVKGNGCQVFEHSEVREFTEAPRSLKVNGHSVYCDYFVIATHVPLLGNTGLVPATLFQTKLASYSSYAIGAKLPRGSAPQALWWDTSDPYYYLRIDRHARHDYAILGGEDHKTGQASGEESFKRLEGLLRTILPKAKADYQWSGQVVETNDGLPFIGETAARQFAATGFAGNGMTFGTLAAIMAADWVLKRDNPWRELFDPARKKLKGAAWDYIKENLDFPYYYLKDRLASADGDSLSTVKRGEGKVLKLDGKKVAVYRDADGSVTRRSPVCTHMGCLVHWNEAGGTWDCPCHGSRFQPTGEVLAGPAESPLEEVKAEAKNGKNGQRSKRNKSASGLGRRK